MQKLIQPTGGGTITLTFTSFATEAGYDFVRVYNGATTSSPLMGTYSGTSLPPVLTSTGGSMLITFTTDGSVTAAGWSANHTLRVQQEHVSMKHSLLLRGLSLTIAVHRIISTTCRAEADTTTGATSVTLTFTSFTTEAGYDFVRVYNGATTSSPLMGTYSGTSLPPVLTSTGGSMLITFTTDGSVTAAGWSATYTSRCCRGMYQ